MLHLNEGKEDRCFPRTDVGEALFPFSNFQAQFQLPKRCSQTRILPSFLQGVLLNKERMWRRSLHKVYISRGKLNSISSPEAWRLFCGKDKASQVPPRSGSHSCVTYLVWHQQLTRSHCFCTEEATIWISVAFSLAQHTLLTSLPPAKPPATSIEGEKAAPNNCPHPFPTP